MPWLLDSVLENCSRTLVSSPAWTLTPSAPCKPQDEDSGASKPLLIEASPSHCGGFFEARPPSFEESPVSRAPLEEPVPLRRGSQKKASVLGGDGVAVSLQGASSGTALPVESCRSRTSDSSSGVSLGAAARRLPPPPGGEQQSRGGQDGDPLADKDGECKSPPPFSSLEEVSSYPFSSPASTSASSSSQKPRRPVWLLNSVFQGKPPVIFFESAEHIGESSLLPRTVRASEDTSRTYFAYGGQESRYAAVMKTLEGGGLYRVKEECGKWLLLWTSHVTLELIASMQPHQRTNHFPGSKNLGRKDLLLKHLAKMHSKFGEAYNIAPRGFVLPKGAKHWRALRQESPDSLWIWKPCNGRCGKKISIIGPSEEADKVEEVCTKPGVVQRYVPNPLLINGFKFDLRIYVVVLSYDPLKVYLFDEGLVRFATEKYTLDAGTLGSRTMHLTNYSINKFSPDFVKNLDNPKEDDTDGEASNASKWSFQELRKYFETNNLDYDGLFGRIKDLIIKTLIAAEPSICAACTDPEGTKLTPGCFEIYGFDVLVDDVLKPWLLEVNIYPSLRTDSPLDKRIKTQLVADTFTLLGLQQPTVRKHGSAKVVSKLLNSSFNSSLAMPKNVRSEHAGRTKEAVNLASMQGAAAVAAFDETAWDIVLEAHDEEMRSGNLELIFPTAEAKNYVPYMSQESFGNVVLRKWYEAGGGAGLILPPRLTPGASTRMATTSGAHGASLVTSEAAVHKEVRRLPPPPTQTNET